ncbi:helix-turn-helix domain-containing protein [Aquabacterium sp. A7-Y]|uniref:helix-turn-helix domain-containing protein n=1 Tax=Aquabacterium sp. A7-Y TaxID=1349605 RepID=UPI00223D6678|nr:helix-turn-helix domain-containing protein [Aquabacterium sp. A7-Y]MCW7541080.1 helix-turn-helix domain-containing protein [Aquabacterium sp. A7-Y]
MRRVTPTPRPADPLVSDAVAFGVAVRAARTASGLTLADAAAALGIAKQTLSDLETARASVGLATALKAARELGVTIFAVPSSEREPARRALLGTGASAESDNAGVSGAASTQPGRP